jgi:hypothetical protein
MPMNIGLLMGTNENWVLDVNEYWALWMLMNIELLGCQRRLGLRNANENWSFDECQ